MGGLQGLLEWKQKIERTEDVPALNSELERLDRYLQLTKKLISGTREYLRFELDENVSEEYFTKMTAAQEEYDFAITLKDILLQKLREKE